MKLTAASLAVVAAMASPMARGAEPFAQWKPQPSDWKGASNTRNSATLTGDKWISAIAK